MSVRSRMGSLARWLTAPARWRLQRWLWRQKDKQRFVRYFRVINALDMNWPVKVTLDSNDLRVADETGSLLLSRTERVRLYRDGVGSRLDRLFSDYLLEGVPIRSHELVVDVGANIGEVSRTLSLRYGCRVLAIEPEIDEFRCLVRNLTGLPATCVNSALWSDETERPFHSRNETGDSSLFEIAGAAAVRRVRTTTLKAVLEGAGEGPIRLLKLEAEGAEPEVLDGAADWVHRIDYVTADVGPERGLLQESTAASVILRMQRAGFELLKVSAPRLVCLFRNSRHSAA